MQKLNVNANQNYAKVPRVGVINSYKRVTVTPSNEPKFSRLASFIPKCSTSSNFPQWAIKSTSQNTLNNSMFMSEISNESIG
jgi:hypothetical protein